MHDVIRSVALPVTSSPPPCQPQPGGGARHLRGAGQSLVRRGGRSLDARVRPAALAPVEGGLADRAGRG
eukprot:6185015-Prymnesium_polylepis.1